MSSARRAHRLDLEVSGKLPWWRVVHSACAGAAVWTFVGGVSVGYMARVYNKMRGGNISERARQEAYAMGAQMAAEEMTRNATAGSNAGGTRR